MIDTATVDRIFEAAQIVDVVSDFVNLKKRGVNYVGLCPFHDDGTPSMYVSPTKGIYKCFSCGEGGNAVNFVMNHERMSYPEALRWLANKYHIEVKETELTDEEKGKRDVRESLFVVNEYANGWFQRGLLSHSEGREYLMQRGVRDDIAKKFQLGYCASDGNALAKDALRNGYRKEMLVKTGLCYEKDNGELRDRYWGRVIFPWHSVSGRVIGFGGRLLDGRTKGVAQKYVNSPESEVFVKHKELYGLYQAKGAIVKKDCVYMVEGYTDVLAMHQCGIENVVANSGTALSVEQIRLLRRFTANITLVYDGDEAGVKASMRGVDMFLKEGMNVRVLLLPDGEDPDSFARKCSESDFEGYVLKHSESFVRCMCRLLLKDVGDDPVKRAEAISAMAHTIGLIPNEVVRYACMKEGASLMEVDEAMMLNETMRSCQGAEEIASVKVKTEELNEPEDELVRILVRYGERVVCQVKNEDDEDVDVSVAEYIYYDLEQDGLEFADPIHRKMLSDAMKCIGNGVFVAEKFFVSHEDCRVNAIASKYLSDRFTLSKYNERCMVREDARLDELVPHLMMEFKLGILKAESNGLMKELSNPDVAKDVERYMGVMARYKEIGEVIKDLSKRIGDRIMV
jgi:DNA primase